LDAFPKDNFYIGMHPNKFPSFFRTILYSTSLMVRKTNS